VGLSFLYTFLFYVFMHWLSSMIDEGGDQEETGSFQQKNLGFVDTVFVAFGIFVFLWDTFTILNLSKFILTNEIC